MSNAHKLGSNTDHEPAPPVPVAPVASEGMPKLYRILLEENEDIPPTGLFIGGNGRTFMLQPGVPAMVPEIVINILKDAVKSVPVIDPTTRRAGTYRNRMRFPFRHLAADEAA